MTRLRSEEGATLIIALFFATAIALVIGALASLTFTSQQAAATYATRGKLVSALDAAIQAGVENARLRQACPPSPDLDLSGANAINGDAVRVHCETTATPQLLRFTATAICPPPPAAQPATQIVATARLATIGGGTDPPRIARLTSWQIVTGGCT